MVFWFGDSGYTFGFGGGILEFYIWKQLIFKLETYILWSEVKVNRKYRLKTLMWQSKKQRGPIFDGYLVFTKFMPFCAPGFLCICKFTSIYMKARYDLDLSHIKNQPPCLTITSCEVGMKHRFEESLKGNRINKLNFVQYTTAGTWK